MSSSSSGRASSAFDDTFPPFRTVAKSSAFPFVTFHFSGIVFTAVSLHANSNFFISSIRDVVSVES